MKTKLSLFFLLFSLIAAHGQTQTSLNISKERNTWQTFTYDMGNVFKSVGHSYSRPVHWKGEQWLNFAGVAAGTATLFFVDDEFNDWVDGFREDVPSGLVEFGNRYGSPENNYALTGAVYLTGLFTKNEKLRRTGVLLIASATAGGFLQQVSKRIIGRARPKSGESSDVFDPFHLQRVRNFDSFPSGHAILAFTNAYAIAKQFKSPWVKAGIYTVGLIPGFARIVDEFHWISDVAFGTVLSIFIVESIDRYLDSKYDQKYNDGEKKVSWDLNFAPGQIGVRVTF
ncbi:phosphatase PAP2 family protein [Leptobacterium flavescens]|uniref:Phosphatase PAP2 family protein n=1 Tax=Leptobacterium flavescens TaxID=472055 RepID=A0A6P0UM59_9FLAO|nr:phosphatase PAP2 family protein [Leptobacterium flavescens]NER12948.1 phosphatase PAP2 family protein [Leptobacterium flavescens]